VGIIKLLNHPLHAEAILKTVGEAIITVDIAQMIRFANGEVERVFGYAPGELDGRKLQVLIPAEYRARHAAGFARAIANEELRSLGGYVEFEGLRKDGEIFPLELRFASLEIEGARFYTASVRDIAERRRAQEAIKWRGVAEVAHEETEAAQAQIEADYDEQVALQKVRDIIWNMEDSDQETLVSALPGILDDLHIRYNNCGINIVNTQAEIEEVTFREMLTPRATFSIEEEAVSRTLYNIWQGQKTCYRPDLQREDSSGERAIFERFHPGVRCVIDVPFSHGTLAVNSKKPDAFSAREIGRMEKLAEVISEGYRRIDDLQALEERTAAAEAANRAKSVFLANMSHELRTPLNAILGFTQLLDRSVHLDDGERENLGIISRSGEHLLSLINDVLEMSRIEAGRTVLEEEVFDLHELLDSMAAMFSLRAEGQGLQLVCEYDAGMSRYVRADEGKLRQILINLLGNAVKFTQAGGVALRGRLVEERLAIEVQDTGSGIADEEQAGLFDAFVQTQTGRQAHTGTGLGLAISQQFAQLMGGEISVQSAVGEGSTFRLEMPVGMADAAEIARPQEARRVVGLAAGQPEWRILIVDDSADNRLLLRQVLESVGFALREAEDGAECIAVWRAWQPQLIWMDMRMPVMDGYEATQAIKATEAGAATKIIALTASAFEEDRQKVLDAGCDDFLRKPFRAEELFARMGEHIDVCFVYAEEREADGAVLTAAALAELPAAWRQQVYEAAHIADEGTLEALIAEIEADHPALAAGLTALVRDFGFDQLMHLTGSAGE